MHLHLPPENTGTYGELETARSPQFPPRDEWDIAAYDTDELVAGYRDYRPDDPAPGPNHSPAYRWGWTNKRKDMTREPDGFEVLRHRYIQLAKRPH
jgi:hypothetical protein